MSAKSPITTHILDTARGRPASGVRVELERRGANGFELVGDGTTDDDGRLATLMAPESLSAGEYRIRFDTGAYFERLEQRGFYPEVAIVFVVEATDEHYHVPLLLNPFGYSTYRGS